MDRTEKTGSAFVNLSRNAECKQRKLQVGDEEWQFLQAWMDRFAAWVKSFDAP